MAIELIQVERLEQNLALHERLIHACYFHYFWKGACKSKLDYPNFECTNGSYAKGLWMREWLFLNINIFIRQSITPLFLFLLYFLVGKLKYFHRLFYLILTMTFLESQFYISHFAKKVSRWPKVLSDLPRPHSLQVAKAWLPNLCFETLNRPASSRNFSEFASSPSHWILCLLHHLLPWPHFMTRGTTIILSLEEF